MKNKVLFWEGVSVLAGTIIGAGIFGIPYVYAQAGMKWGIFWLILITAILTITHLIIGDIALRTSDKMRFVGIINSYLPRSLQTVANTLLVITLFGGIVAYMLLGGGFFTSLVGLLFPVSKITGLLIYFFITGLIVYTGLQTVKKADIPMVILMVMTLLIISIACFIKFDPVNFSIGSTKNWFLPYGVTLFALSAMSAVPIIELILKADKTLYKKVIITSGIIASVITGLFGLAVAGVSGVATSQDAIAGLFPYFGGSIIIAGALVGLLTIITSHIVLAHQLKEIFMHDLHWNRIFSLLAVTVLPLWMVLYFKPDFIDLIGKLGGITGAGTGILIGIVSIISHKKTVMSYSYHLPLEKFWAGVIIVAFSIGLAIQIFKF